MFSTIRIRYNDGNGPSWTVLFRVDILVLEAIFRRINAQKRSMNSGRYWGRGRNCQKPLIMSLKTMTRKSRPDAPGALHHIIVRGIERRSIFFDGRGYQNFLERLDHLLTDSKTRCHAWALMKNHVHLLLGTGMAPISTLMRRRLTGYARQFNRRHERCRVLFQNRYKSFTRAVIGIVAIDQMGFSGAEVARELNLTPSAVSKLVLRACNDPTIEDAVKDMPNLF